MQHQLPTTEMLYASRQEVTKEPAAHTTTTTTNTTVHQKGSHRVKMAYFDCTQLRNGIHAARWQDDNAVHSSKVSARNKSNRQRTQPE